MTEGVFGIVVLCSVAAISAIGWHLLVRSFLLAIVLSTASAVIVFQALAYIHMGYLDPFFPIAVITSSALCLFVSVVVGLVVRSCHKKSGGKENVF